MKRFSWLTSCFVLAVLLSGLVTTTTVRANSNSQHPSVRAAIACIDQIQPIVNKRQIRGKDVSCNIPVTLSEKDLDELFKAAARSASANKKVQGFAEKYSSKFAKTLTNFRAANCSIRLRIKRRDIVNALDADRLELQLDDQPAECDVTTKKRKVQKLKFSFAPRVSMYRGCVEKFALNMGKIDAGCRVCYFNRLYLSTKLVGLWANHMSGNIRRVLNTQLSRSCRQKD